jgi:hypothetical protein
MDQKNLASSPISAGTAASQHENQCNGLFRQVQQIFNDNDAILCYRTG